MSAMGSCGVLLSVVALLTNLAAVLATQGGGGLTVQKGPNNKYSVKWETECAAGVKHIIQCSKCECDPSDGTALNCKIVPCLTHRFKPYNTKSVPIDQLVCVPDAEHTVCEECFCFQPGQPGQMCLRMQCPPMIPA